MTIAIIGAGAIGSVVAGYLTKAGIDVTLIGRADQTVHIKQHGLKINGVRGEETIKVKVQTLLERDYDLVIFTVKTQDIDTAVAENKEFLNNSLILSSQNGVQADLIFKKHFSKEKLYSSIVMFGATYIRLGEVSFIFEGDWIIGKPHESDDKKVQEITDILKNAFSAVVSDDIVGMKWLKLFVNFNNCIPALLGKSMQETFADIDLCRLSVLLSKEGVDIVQKANIKLVSLPQFPAERISGLVNMPIEQASEIINKTLTTLSKEPIYGSILQSIMRKRTSEIDYINGEVVRLAKQLGIDAPLNNRIVELVHQVENSGKYFDIEKIKNEFQLNETTKAELT